MRRRKVVLVGAVAAALATLLAAACTFPDVEFASSAAEGGSREGEAEGEARDGATADGGVDGRPPLDASPPLDATSEKPNIGACASACDCDDDKASAGDAGCGGKDCDDQDPRAFPGQNFLKELATLDTKGDWNCNGETERLHDVVGASPCSGLAGAACDRIRGLVSDIPCGTYGEYVACGTGALNLCVKVDGGTAQQECR